MRKTIILISMITILGMMSCSTLPPTQTTNPIPQTKEATIPLLATSTLSVPKPEKSSNLLPVNAADEVFENGVWVVKNTEGMVTANWNSQEEKWNYNLSNIQMVLSGETTPILKAGIGSSLPKDNFMVPYEWKKGLPESQMDPNPIVPLGYIDTITEVPGRDSGGNIWHLQEFGVDFRGIKFADWADDPKNRTGCDSYVAGFTLTNPQYPDRLYLITIPLLDNASLYSNVDIFAGGTYQNAIGTSTIMPPPDGILGEYSLNELIPVLKDPTVIGRRMVIVIWVSDTGEASNDPNSVRDLFYNPGQNTLVDAIASGTSFGKVDAGITEQHLRVPHDLHALIPKSSD